MTTAFRCDSSTTVKRVSGSVDSQISRVHSYDQYAFSSYTSTEMKQTESNAVPKFASFRPKEVHSQEDDKGIEAFKAKQRSNGRDSTSAIDRRFGEGQKRPRGSKDTRDVDAPDARVKGQEHLYDLYVIDRAGDQNNVTFGTINRRKIPHYVRSGAGALIGLSRAQRIDRTKLNDHDLLLSKAGASLDQSDERLVSRSLRSFTGKEQELIPRARNVAEDLVHMDYVPLEDSRPAKRMRTSHDKILGQLASDEDDFSDPEAGIQAQQSERGLAYQGDTIKRAFEERQAFTQKLDANPRDIEAWLGLIACQDSVLEQGSSKESQTSAERQSTAEIKISVYEKALKNIKEPSRRERLLIGMMEQGVLVWPAVTVSAKWRSVLHEHSSYLRLWVSYLNFRQTTFVGFTYDAVRQTYVECFELLRKARSKLIAGSQEEGMLCDIQIYVLLRMSLYMREAGVLELALAAWQAILEYNLRRPESFETPPQESSKENTEQGRMRRFENFWDSEVARIGEEGARGWSTFELEGPSAGTSVPPKSQRTSSALNIFSHWAALERQRSRASRNIARTMDETEENDPYRVVLFSDIEPNLFSIPEVSHSLAILDAFLAFCHLPTFHTTSNYGRTQWWTNEFIRNDSLYMPREQGNQQFHASVGYYNLDQHTMFSNAAEWFSTFSNHQESQDLDVPVDRNVISRTLHALIEKRIAGDDLIMYYLALELKTSPSSVRKKAKKLVKEQPSNLRLYNTYALLEYRLKEPEKADKVIVTALKMTPQLEGKAKHDAMLLWLTWVWELVLSEKYDKALDRLAHFANESQLEQTVKANESASLPPFNTASEEARKRIIGARDNLSSHGLLIHATAAAELLILLSYLEDPSTLALATTAFKDNLTILSTLDPTENMQERLHQSFARLIHHHVTHVKLFKPAEVRSLLAESIRAFPQNTIFLSLYAWNESRFSIDDRVRSIVREVLHQQDADDDSTKSVIPHFFVIDAELARGTTLGSNTNAIRGTFERALNTQACKHCAGMWKMYFEFEHSRGGLKRAKSVLYRAIRACPWFKELYMLAFERLNKVEGGMSETELRSVYDLMEEKGLRVHVELEELIEQREKT